MEFPVTDIGGDFLVLRDYLAGALPADQERAIEERLERDPRLVRELELHLRMREGLAQVHAQRQRAQVTVRQRRATWTSGLAAAASCAGLALLLWTHQGAPDVSLLQPDAGSPAASAGAPPVTTQFTFVPVRGAASPVLDLPASGLVDLRTSPGVTQGTDRYQLTLVREDAQGGPRPVGSLKGIAVAGHGYLHAYVDASRLQAGQYLLSVAPTTKAADAGDGFRFTLRPGRH